ALKPFGAKSAARISPCGALKVQRLSLCTFVAVSLPSASSRTMAPSADFLAADLSLSPAREHPAKAKRATRAGAASNFRMGYSIIERSRLSGVRGHDRGHHGLARAGRG